MLIIKRSFENIHYFLKNVSKIILKLLFAMWDITVITIASSSWCLSIEQPQLPYTSAIEIYNKIVIHSCVSKPRLKIYL